MATLVYRYGLLPPTVGAETVAEQISLGHRYYNLLVEIERERRDKVRAVLGAHPNVKPLGAEVENLVSMLAAAQTAIREERQQTRKRTETDDQRTDVRVIRIVLKEARDKYRAARRALREDEQVQSAIDAINTEMHARHLRAGSDVGMSPGSWGTRGMLYQAFDQACKTALDAPSFRRWSGTGAVAVQFQPRGERHESSRPAGGITWKQATSCTDTRIQISLKPQPCGAGKPRPRVRLRIDSDGRDPVWVEWPVILHRPLPDDALIMWATAKRERLAGKDRWSLHLSIDVPDVAKKSVGQGIVAVDVGWRQRPDGIRVAYLRDDTNYEREVILDPAVVSGIMKTEDLRSIRDQHLNELQPWLNKWLRAHELPEWLTERTQTLHQWRSAARFASLALTWREQRWNEDTEAFTRLDEWRKKDKHLWVWEANQRDKSLRRRREQYRLLGVELSRKYHTLVLENFDLRQTQRHVAVESEEIEIQAARSQQRLAAVSELRNCLVQAFAKRGGRVIYVPAENTTRACWYCGTKDQWDAVDHLYHRCSQCGKQWDQDDNACRNLLARARECLSDRELPDGARIKDYATVEPRRPAKWAKLGKHKATARGGVASAVES